MKKLILLSLMFFFYTNVHSQIFGGLMNEAKRKLERKIENKIVEAVSEELAKRAFKPIDEAIDSIMKEKYKDSIHGGRDVDWSKAGESYAAFIAGMNKSVNIPEKYTFDFSQEVEIQDYSNKVSKIKLHYSKKDTIIGMEDLEEKDIQQFIVIDIPQDAMIIFSTDKNGKKTGIALSSVMSMSSAMIKSIKTDSTAHSAIVNIEKTGKKKKIAGLQSLEYKGDTADENFVMYVSTEQPVRWGRNYVNYFSQFAPRSYTENSLKIDNGIMLEYKNTRKNEEKATTWSTQKFIEKSFDIKKSEYKFD